MPESVNGTKVTVTLGTSDARSSSGDAARELATLRAELAEVADGARRAEEAEAQARAEQRTVEAQVR